MKLAIIGAGLAGLTCAKTAREAGHEVTLFDKGRGPGGRCSTRRAESPIGELRFDHGTIGFRPHSEEFRQMASDWVETGLVKSWQPRAARLSDHGLEAIRADKSEAQPWYVGAPAMNALIKTLAAEETAHFGIRLHKLERDGASWRLSFEDDHEDMLFDGVVVAVPAEQAGPILDTAAPQLAHEARTAEAAPCWSVMLGFDRPLPLEFDLIVGDGAPFTRIVRNASKPDRPAGESWVLQASAEWSRTHVDRPKEEVGAELLSAFQAVANISFEPVLSMTHRWLYARTSKPVGTPASWDDELKIGTCGDWHLGPELEHAWLSGRVLGERLKSLAYAL